MESSKKPASAKITGFVTKTEALKKFIRVAKNTPSPRQASPPVQDTVRLTGQNSLQMLSLKGICEAQMHREMGDMKHVRIKAPRQRRMDCSVQKEKRDKSKKKRVGVLKAAHPLDPDFPKIFKRFPGPRLSANGDILPHSILGDVDRFLTETNKRKGSQKVTKTKDFVTKKVSSLAPMKRASSTLHPLLDQDGALAYWQLEMCSRKQEQKRLANILNRPAKKLLMARTDFFHKQIIEKTACERSEERFHPDACFWTQQPSCGSRQIMSTLTKTERGHLKTPLVCGDGAKMAQEKGQSDLYKPSSWTEADYEMKPCEDSAGVIHIANSELFRDLEVFGEAIVPAKKGDSTTDHSTNCVDSDNKNEDSNKSKIVGPSLCVDGTTLGWFGNSAIVAESERIAKETFILIEAKVGDIVKSHMTFENNGTVVLKYFWKKEAVFHPLPVQRPPRRPFYCYDDSGSILPGQIIHVPVLFRSQIPGYFTESWLLDTVPVLENGAKIKFTLKGVARDVTDMTKQRMEIEEYLRRKQVETLCRQEVDFIVDSAILKSMCNSDRDKEEPVALTTETLFEETNPGFFYHGHIIKDLWVLFDIVTKDNNVVTKEVATKGSVLCLSNLRNMIVNFLCPVTEEEDEDDHYDRMDELFDGFCRNVMDLSYRPLVPTYSQAQKKHFIMHTLLQQGLDGFTNNAHKVAQSLGLVVEDKVMDIATPEVKQEQKSGSHKSKARTTDSSKGKIKDSKEASPTREFSSRPMSNGLEDQAEASQFSPVAKYRQRHGHGGSGANMEKYEEKTYVMMYGMLTNIMDVYYDLFN